MPWRANSTAVAKRRWTVLGRSERSRSGLSSSVTKPRYPFRRKRCNKLVKGKVPCPGSR